MPAQRHTQNVEHNVEDERFKFLILLSCANG